MRRGRPRSGAWVVHLEADEAESEIATKKWGLRCPTRTTDPPDVLAAVLQKKSSRSSKLWALFYVFAPSGTE
jgi:hypothetical protein